MVGCEGSCEVDVSSEVTLMRSLDLALAAR